MKILKFLFSWTLTYNIISMFINLYNYIKDVSVISDVFYGNDFKTVLKNYVNLDIKKDWIGRLYGIINPNIDINGNFDLSNTIMEIDGDNTNNNEYVKHWTYKQLTLIGNLFKIDKLWNYIDLTFTHVGPINGDNFLLVFDILSRKEFAKSFKRVLLQSLTYIVIAIVILLIIGKI